MVIGDGLIAKKFVNYDNANIIFFASGVSNSLEIGESEFTKEKIMLGNIILNNMNKLLIYFSSTSIYYNRNRYVLHKIEIEEIIKNSGINFFIFRLPQVLGKGGSKNNLINFLINQITQKNPFKVFNTERSIIDIDDVFNIVIKSIESYPPCRTFDISGIGFCKVTEIVYIIEKCLNLESNYSIVDEKSNNFYKLNSPEIETIINELKINKPFYIKNTIEKYVRY